MKNSIIFILFITLWVSCTNKNNFKISGTVKNASGEKLYFLQDNLLKSIVLDSVKLDENGSFTFSSTRPEYPEFYSLKLNNKSINFAVDSCEKIVIETQNKGFATNYEISGSQPSLRIRDLRKSIMNIELQISELRNITVKEDGNNKVEQIKKDIEAHKQMAKKLILENPRSTAAYFALYQQVNNTYLFVPTDKEDRIYFSAVATAYNTYMPEYIRTKNIYGLVLDAIKTERKVIQKQNWDNLMEESGVGYIDIVLPDRNNKESKLSELEGKVILIDFSTYNDKESIAYTFSLRELYDKYKSKGFEIYQISLDNNKLLWEETVQNLPWICVRDNEGANNPYLQTYNVRTIPTTFLLTRKGDIIARDLNFAQLDKEIKKNL